MNRTARNKILYRFKRLQADIAGLGAYLDEIDKLSGGRPEALRQWISTGIGMLGMMAAFFGKMERLYRGEETAPLPTPEDLLPPDFEDGA